MIKLQINDPIKRTKNWDRVQTLKNTNIKLAGEIETSMIEVANKLSKLTSNCLEAYELAPEKDCLLYDSPLAPAKIDSALKQALLKYGWKLTNFYGDPTKIKTFREMITEGMDWILKGRKNEKSSSNSPTDDIL